MPDHSRTSITVAPPKDVSNAQLVQWAFDRINAQDVDSLRNLWTVDTTVNFPTGTCHGSAEIAAYFDQVFAAVEDFAFDVVSIAESGNDVLVHWHLMGRHVGTFVGVAGTGRRIEFEGFDHFVIMDGKVVTNTVRYDQMEFARQIKLLPPDGSIADRALKAAFNTATRVVGIARRH
ncbi:MULTISPECIES: ester cyclase [unclassified Rhodococcus (in: high G+C Gram-positive bacteria)]|uniref:ester cyclase n=1 Tax=unclassified Rhodococcus (in: high G+C Gram-positive bacteria) TaxID=192944 RepID=UPI00163B159A|nr:MULTISPECIES: ester cyclase [unclassified Rhodococcus (in: high G+C Gram-positive bacteria)]MBC2642600.1 ester cyclase [Rhodococcus sp. 3A]MBC2892658.1 ester cyclase [Rhodococcus sp. 4CII]